MDKLSKKEENEMYKDKCNQMITNQEIPKITKDEYKILEFNEFGGQRNVFRGKYKGHDVAIKINKDLDYKLLAHELFIISELQHENIEKLYGVCLDDNEITIVTEYIDGTTLDVMNKSEDRISAIKDICAGIAYIHNNDLGIIHRALK